MKTLYENTSWISLLDKANSARIGRNNQIIANTRNKNDLICWPELIYFIFKTYFSTELHLTSLCNAAKCSSEISVWQKSNKQNWWEGLILGKVLIYIF